MNRKSKFVLIIAFAELLFAYRAAYAVTPNLPSWDDVRKIVDQQLNNVGDYQSGDLISRNQVDPVFDALQRAGWTVRDRADILNMVCSDRDAIVRQFRSGSGKQFMRQINKSSLGYDRVDQIDRMTGGRT